MSCGTSNFPKDFPGIPTLTDDTIITVSDGSVDPGTSIKAYKTTLNDIGSYIGHHALDPPVEIQDLVAFQSSFGTISVSGTTGTLSSSVDHSNLSVGDIIAFPSGPSWSALPTTVITAVGTFPDLTVTVFPFVDISPGQSFTYGPPTLTTKNSAGDIINSITSEGIISLKTLLVVDTSELADTSFFNSGGLSVIGELFATGAVRTSTYSSYPTVGYSDLRSADDAYIVQRSVDDGMVTYYHRPMLNAVMSSNQTMTLSTWNPVKFNKVDGTDVQGTTKSRIVVGGTIYDTTNYAYAIPYGTHYPDAAYMITANLSVTLTGAAGTRFYITINSGASATGDQLSLGETILDLQLGVTAHDFSLTLSRMVYLKPLSIPNHRFIRIRAYYNGTAATINYWNDRSWFSLVCLG